MTARFINSLQGVYDYVLVNGSTTTLACDEAIDHYQFYQFCLIPAVIITLAFALTKKRQNIWLNILGGRPGLIDPMQTFTRSSTIAYACAFGATGYLVYQIVIEQVYAIDYTDGNRWIRPLVAIASMFIYGLVFFPVFSSLTVDTVFSLGVGSVYVWLLTAIDIFKLTECDMSDRTRVLVVFRNLPSTLCLLYLSVAMPGRLVRAYKKGRYFHWEDDKEEKISLEDIRDSYSGHHVTKLLKKPVFKPPPVGVNQIAMAYYHRYVYQREKGFRYPSQMVAVMFVSMLVIYTLALEILAVFPDLIDQLVQATLYIEDLTVGLYPIGLDTEEDALLRDILDFLWVSLKILKVCVIVSCVVAAIFAILNVLHTMTSYRQNLFALYRGDHSYIPPASAYSNRSHCVNGIKYAGYQVGYIIWSFLLQVIILVLVSFLLGIFILLMINGYSDWAWYLVEILLPILVSALLVFVAQNLLAQFVFLQERGQFLALNNRHSYFNFAYFMFFYNIFLGLVSCLLRILKAMIVGILFLSRLDNSTLPRRFEGFDPGFKAYMGAMHIEVAHTHPVVIVFTRIMMLGLQHKRERVRAQEGKLNATKAGATQLNGAHTGFQDQELEKGGKHAQMNDAQEGVSEEKRRGSQAARFKWQVTYTLLHNPDLRVMRVGYLQMLRQAKLLGVLIPVSDKQADINLDKLQQDITDAREKYNLTTKKSKEKMSDVEAGQGDTKKSKATKLSKADQSQVKGENSPPQREVTMVGDHPSSTTDGITAVNM